MRTKAKKTEGEQSEKRRVKLLLQCPEMHLAYGPEFRQREVIRVENLTRDEAIKLARDTVARWGGAEVVEDWAAQPEAIIAAVVKAIDGDGHTIFDPSLLRGAGVPEELVQASTTKYESNPDHWKETIFAKNGQPVREMTGVYGLSVLWAIRDAIGAASSMAMGRGFLARALSANIMKRLEAYR